MPIQIIDVEMSDFEAAGRYSRARTPETVELMHAIEDLRPDQAKAVLLEPDEFPNRIAAKLRYVAKIAGVSLLIAHDPNDNRRILFGLRQQRRRTPNLTPARAADARRELIRQAALAVAREKWTFMVEDVVEKLPEAAVEGITRPSTMVAATLRHMEGFERVGFHQYRYVDSA